MLKEAWISIKANKLRSFLTILGIIIGVCAVVLMVAAGQTVQNEINKQLSTIGGNVMIITPGSAGLQGVQKGRGSRPTLTESDAKAIRNVRNVAKVSPAVRRSEQMIHGANNWYTSVVGSNLDYLEIADRRILRGISFTEREMKTGTPFIIIGTTVEEKLFHNSEDPIGKYIRIKNVPFKVIGVFEEKGSSLTGEDEDDFMFTSVKAYKSKLSNNRFPNMVHVIILKVDKEENMTLVERRINSLLRERHKIREGQDNDFSITNLTEIANKIKSIGFILSMLLLSIAAISLIVGSIGIMNMMLVSVTERTKEIGIRKAVGASNKDILAQFLSESILMSFIGSFIGMVLGIVLSQVGQVIFNKEVPISIITVILSMAVAATVGIASGIFPAIKATKLDPIEALRYQ